MMGDPTWDEEDEEGDAEGGDGAEAAARRPVPRTDPLAALAEAAGHDDPERWWEDVVEHRAPGDGSPAGALPDGSGAAAPGAADPFAPFAAVAEAMGALRDTPGGPATGTGRDAVREAHMRLRIRAARKEYGDAIAVVCGAWHVPALDTGATTATADRALLKGLPKVRTDITWVPWSHRRLARRSGYGAGITSPGWYAHLFHAADRPLERWMTKVAHLLRAEDHPVSSAHVIEAVRLARTLAAVRGRPAAGQAETTDAVRAVMCDGSDVPLALVRDRLVVGDVLGEVPDAAPAVPLQRDLARLQRSLRLKPAAPERELDLDLRKETDAARSRLLHRLRLLGVDWGVPAGDRGGTGTFREGWRLRWEPELHPRVAEAGIWGTTVLAAATAKARAQAASARSLTDVTTLAEHCLLAGLPEALPRVMRSLADLAALDADIGRLARALPALARALRYGDVRSTDTAALAEVATGLALRVCVGLPPACTGLDADGAAEMRGHLDAVHAAIRLLPDIRGLRTRWGAALRGLTARDRVPGSLRGRATRLLLDGGRLPEDDAARLMALALSPGARPADAAAWIEGFLGAATGREARQDRSGGLLLVHDERLLRLVDSWLAGVPADAFTDVLPLLRRTFSTYDTGVRRTLGELVRRGPSAGGGRPALREDGAPEFGAGLDEARADGVLPVLRLLLGSGHDHREPVGAGR